MDSTLNQILEDTNDTQEIIFNSLTTIDDCVASIQKISSYVSHLKSVMIRIKNIHNICLERINNKICNFETENPINIARIGTKKWDNNILDLEINTDFQTTAKTDIKFKKKNTKSISFGFSTDHSVKPCEVSPGVTMRVKTVKNINEVPNSKLYWVENIKQFAIRVNNILIRGNVGNTYTTKISHIKNTIKCKFGPECDEFISGSESPNCTYYHDPLELVKDNIEVNKPIIRNYTNKSWLFTQTEINNKNKYMKHLGSRDSLKTDVYKLIKANKNIVNNEIDMLINQSMHNLLILLVLSKNKTTSKLTFLGC